MTTLSTQPREADIDSFTEEMCTTLDLTGSTVLCVTNVEISIPDVETAMPEVDISIPNVETASVQAGDAPEMLEEAPIISGITVTDSTGATHILG